MASSDKIPQYFKLDKLVADITECVASLSQEFSCMNIPIDDSCTVFHRFCAKLEQFLSSGLKEKNLFGKKRNYWDYMLRCLVSNRGGVHEGLKFVKNNTELKTSVGRGRAFLRFCLVHQCLADALQQCVLGAAELTPEWYANWAPIRDEAAFNLLITSLYDLSHVQFDLSSPSCHDLDLSWPTFNRKEFGSPFNWKAISRSASISSLTSSISAVDTFNNSRSMGAMGSVQEGSEGSIGRGSEGIGERQESLEQGTSAPTQGNPPREESDEKEVWWMSEEQANAAAGGGGDLAEGVSAEANSWPYERRRELEVEEQLRSLECELKGREEEWGRERVQWERQREGEWEEKERGWKEEVERVKEEHRKEVLSFRETEEEKRLEVDMLKAKLLELEVVSTMANWASVGVQATSEDDSETKKRIEAEEKLASVCQENEELKVALEKMRISYKEDRHKFPNCEFCSKEREASQASPISETKSQPRHDDDLRREYESQIRNVRELRGMYEERMKAAEEQSRKLREDLQDKTRRLELSRRRCSELRAHSQELETLLGEQEGVARGLQTRLSASLEEGRALAAQLATVNRLFGRLGDTAELDFERLRLLQHSSEEGKDECDCRSASASSNSANKADGSGGNGETREEGSELKEIAASLPKVWRLLVELLGEEQKEEEEKASEGTADTDGCFDSVPTPYGPRLVISVSRTFIRLKDLILEKKTLQNELGRIRDLNGRLESKLKQQERRLATVKVELKRTWGLVGRMRAQHKQLHTSEQVLRYELQQKRKLLGELKQELEYCREKWELARMKNSQSEKEWQLLRQEFTARRSVDGEPSPEAVDVNSPESGFSDGRGEDEEEDLDVIEGGNELDGACDARCSEGEALEGDDCINLQAETSPLHDEENQMLPIDLNFLSEELHIDTENPNPPNPEDETGNAAAFVTQPNETNISNEEVQNVKETSDCPSSEDLANVGSSSSLSAPEMETGSQQAGASVERTMEERLHARAERLRRLEEQCDLLFRKVTRTTTRSAELSSRLEELHEQYGDQQGTSEESRRESPIVADTETGETPPENVSSLRLQCPSQFPHQESGAPRPPTPPPFPTSLSAIRLPSLIDHCHNHSSNSNLGIVPVLPSNAENSFRLSSNSTVDINSEIQNEGNLTVPVEHVTISDGGNESVSDETVSRLYASHELQIESDDRGDIIPVVDDNLPVEELLSASVTPVVVPVSEEPEVHVPPTLFPQSDFEELLEANESVESEEIENIAVIPEESDIEAEASIEASVDETGMLEDDEDESIRLSRERSTEGSVVGEEREEMDEEAYIAGMSATIYGLHHGPLFDEGISPSDDDDDDEEECGEEDVAEEDEDIEDTDEEGLNVTSGSIGVASLLLQQLPKRMDILRRERHSLEQRLEEGEAALGRALAGTAAAERRARTLERGLAQAQERLRVLEMEAAVERNERLLEIKSALDMTSRDNANGSNLPENVGQDGQSNSNRLQEEIDNLQKQTLAQIAEFQAAAIVSKAQKEQLCNLNEEIERQEKVVKCLEGEVASLRKEREEQSTALKDARVHLKDALVLIAKSQEDGEAKQLQIDKLKEESDQSNKENIGLHSRLTDAESEITKLNAEIKQLKDDSDHLREAVVKLTGEKETLFRSNHNLEEMRRLVLEDSRWVADRESETCTACGVTFSLMIRRHHCRSCGKIFCGACSSHWLALNSVSTSQATSLVAGVVESLMGVAGAGKRSRACADCFAAYSGENAECVGGEPCSGASFPSGGTLANDKPCSSSSLQGSSDAELSASANVEGQEENYDDDDEDDAEDFSMISEEEVVLSQCTPYVPNPRTLQYWKSCEIQSGVMSTASDLLAACVPNGGEPGKGKGEEVWVRAGAIYSVPLLIEETRVNILWEFSTNPNSIAFSVLYKSSADIPMSCALIVVPTTRVNSHLNSVHGRLRPKRAGVYILMFDNSFSRFTGKTISYCLRAETSSKGASGRESVTSSSRSSVEPFPDLPIHPDEMEDSSERGMAGGDGETGENNEVTKTDGRQVDDEG